MHATPFPPKPQRPVITRVHGTHARPAVALPARLRPAPLDVASSIDWPAQARLATVLSVIGVIVAVGLHGLVPASVIVAAMVAVSAALSARRLHDEPRAARTVTWPRH